MTRDELLARIDERTSNMWRVLNDADDSICAKLTNIESHLIKLNGKSSDNAHGVDTNKKAIAGLGGVIVIIITILLHLMGVY